ncbi:MAG: hypothetical protein J6Q78_01580 [Clostridia bacterium]|nr:hypothetical protein [Clostridia bacterium]
MQLKVMMELAEQELPLWKEIWLYLYNTYFTDEGVYENLGMGTGTLISPKLIIVGLFIGLAIAGFGMVYNKKILGGFVRKLLSEEILSEEKATTLSEIGYEKKALIKRALRTNHALKHVVVCVQEEKYYQEVAKKREEYNKKRKDDPTLPKFKEIEYKIDSENDRFYIPEDKKYLADVRYDAKGATWRGAIAFVIISLIVMIIAIIFTPYILKLIDDLVGTFKNL